MYKNKLGFISGIYFIKISILNGLYEIAFTVFVKIVINIVEVLGGWAVDIEVPVADSVDLAEDCAVGAEEAVKLAGRQAPVPHLQRNTGLLRRSNSQKLHHNLHFYRKLGWLLEESAVSSWQFPLTLFFRKP